MGRSSPLSPRLSFSLPLLLCVAAASLGCEGGSRPPSPAGGGAAVDGSAAEPGRRIEFADGGGSPVGTSRVSDDGRVTHE